MPPPKAFKREKRINSRCVDAQGTWCRIDLVLGMDTGYVFLEVDEYQHRFGYDAMLSCDMKRMAKVMASLTNEAGTIMPNVSWLPLQSTRVARRRRGALGVQSRARGVAL